MSNKRLLHMMRENPELHVLFLVNHSFGIIEGIEMNYVLGNIDDIFVAEYCCYFFYDMRCYVLQNNVKEIQEYLSEKYADLSFDVRNRKIAEELDKIEWKQAIFVVVSEYESKPVL